MSRSSVELFMSVEQALRREAALAAFDNIIAGSAPSENDLAAAPLLIGWRRGVVQVVEPVLVGRVAGHPLLPGERRVVTSPVLALDAAAGWARTESRYYRLASEDI